MITTNLRLESKSDKPSALQQTADAYARMLNTANFALDLMSPFNLAVMAYRFNRSMAKVWGAKVWGIG